MIRISLIFAWKSSRAIWLSSAMTTPTSVALSVCIWLMMTSTMTSCLGTRRNVRLSTTIATTAFTTPDGSDTIVSARCRVRCLSNLKVGAFLYILLTTDDQETSEPFIIKVIKVHFLSSFLNPKFSSCIYLWTAEDHETSEPFIIKVHFLSSFLNPKFSSCILLSVLFSNFV